MYGSGHPNRLAAALNRAWALVGAAGLWRNRLITLEVRGRRTGRPVSFPLIVAEHGGRRYLVAMLGERASWVANVRAARGAAVLRHGNVRPVWLEEVPPAERAPILRRHLQVAPAARSFVPVAPTAPVAAFEPVAAQFPVFRIHERAPADFEPGAAPESPRRPAGAAAVPATRRGGDPGAAPAAGRGAGRGWTVPRIAGVVLGAVLVLAGLALLATGAAGAWLDTSGRHDGFVTLDTLRVHTGGYAVTDATLMRDEVGISWDAALSLFGTARVSAASADGAPVFVGIAAPAQAEAYLAMVRHDGVRDLPGSTEPTYRAHDGGAPATPPGGEGFWTAATSGSHVGSVEAPADATWTLVVMNADGSAPVDATVTLAASAPALPQIALVLVVSGAAVLAAGGVLIAVPVRRARRRGVRGVR